MPGAITQEESVCKYHMGSLGVYALGRGVFPPARGHWLVVEYLQGCGEYSVRHRDDFSYLW